MRKVFIGLAFGLCALAQAAEAQTIIYGTPPCNPQYQQCWVQPPTYHYPPPVIYAYPPPVTFGIIIGNSHRHRHYDRHHHHHHHHNHRRH